MRVLLCLLSDQHVPNLLSAHHYKPDHLVLIETERMKRRAVAQRLLNALKLGGLDYGSKHHVEPLSAEDDLSAVRGALQTAYGRYPSGEWVANVTGGTKPMSIATYEFFKALGGKIVYTNFSRPARIIDLVDGTTDDCSHRLGIHEFLAGYSFESRKADDKAAEAEERAEGWRESAELLARYASDSDVLPLGDNERKKARDKGIELGADRFKFPCDQLRAIWIGGSSTRVLSKHEAEFLTGGWLEVFVWNLLRQRADALGVWDVRLGMEVGRCGDRTGNDFDVSFMHDYGLSMVECKSGAQDHDRSTGILYKVEAVTRQFRALRVRSYLATTSPNVLDKEQNVKPSLQSRSAIYNCKIITGSDIRNLAHESVAIEQVRQVFFSNA